MMQKAEVLQQSMVLQLLIFYNDTDVFGFASDLASNATSATVTSKLGNIETHATANPSSAPTFQGKGSIYVNEASETIWMYS